MTASNAWPNFYFQNGRKVDNQVAAPAETRTPNWHRAKQNRSSKSADGRVATGPARLRRMNEKQNLCRNNLTPTGLLMEGVYTHQPCDRGFDCYRGIAPGAPLLARFEKACPERSRRVACRTADTIRFRLLKSRGWPIARPCRASPWTCKSLKREGFCQAVGFLCVSVSPWWKD